jgi:CRP-like cAMP-binding protein
LRITQRELGSVVGLSRESTNKQLRAWEERGWVRLERGSVAVVNTAALMKLVGPE